MAEEETGCRLEEINELADGFAKLTVSKETLLQLCVMCPRLVQFFRAVGCMPDFTKCDVDEDFILLKLSRIARCVQKLNTEGVPTKFWTLVDCNVINNLEKEPPEIDDPNYVMWNPEMGAAYFPLSDAKNEVSEWFWGDTLMTVVDCRKIHYISTLIAGSWDSEIEHEFAAKIAEIRN